MIYFDPKEKRSKVLYARITPSALGFLRYHAQRLKMCHAEFLDLLIKEVQKLQDEERIKRMLDAMAPKRKPRGTMPKKVPIHYIDEDGTAKRRWVYETKSEEEDEEGEEEK